MSTDAEINQVYKQDARQPFYSLQCGHDRRAQSQTKNNQTVAPWHWGHFPMALQCALAVQPLKCCGKN